MSNSEDATRMLAAQALTDLFSVSAKPVLSQETAQQPSKRRKKTEGNHEPGPAQTGRQAPGTPAAKTAKSHAVRRVKSGQHAAYSLQAGFLAAQITLRALLTPYPPLPSCLIPNPSPAVPPQSPRIALSSTQVSLQHHLLQQADQPGHQVCCLSTPKIAWPLAFLATTSQHLQSLAGLRQCGPWESLPVRCDGAYWPTAYCDVCFEG